MKTTINFFLCISCLAFSISVFGQTKQINNITAVRLTAAVGEQYVNKVNTTLFTVDKDFVLRPTKGNRIIHFSKEKKIAIAPESMKLTATKPTVPGFDIAKVPGGTMFCMCDQGNDDCQIKPRMAENTLTFDCMGRCGCGSFIIFDTSNPIADYETPGGRWFNF